MTFLLVSLAVAVGVGIMNFGQAAAEEEAQCPVKVGMKAAVIAGQDQLCYNAAKKQLSFVLENGVNIAVTGAIVSIVGEQKAETFELEAKMSKAGSYVGNVAYDTAVSGNIRQVKISPQISVQEEDLVCSEEALVVEEVRSC